MIKSKELTDPNSCMSRARDDEMTFVLLGRDKAAAVAIYCWAMARIALGKNTGNDAQIAEALAAVSAMEFESGIEARAANLLLTVALSDFSQRAFTNSHNKGFWDGITLPEMTADIKASKIALMHSELSECLEGIRKPAADSHCPEFTSEEIELADVLIRIGDYASARGLRLGEAVLAKMKFNESRPYKHGKAI